MPLPKCRITLDLPDLPLMFTQGQQTMDGQGYFNKDIYVGETLAPEHITPYQSNGTEPPAPKLFFKSTRK